MDYNDSNQRILTNATIVDKFHFQNQLHSQHFYVMADFLSKNTFYIRVSVFVKEKGWGEREKEREIGDVGKLHA